MLRPAERDAIADIKMPADERVIDLIEEAFRRDRFIDETVPDILHGDGALPFFRRGNATLDALDTALPALLVGHVFLHGAGNEEDALAAELSALFQSDLQRANGAFANLRLR